MKVVLFCGGLGLRMQEAAPSIPKPMVPIASRPILLQIMKYYAHFGHKDFIICLGHRGEVIKDFSTTTRRSRTTSSSTATVEGWSSSRATSTTGASRS